MKSVRKTGFYPRLAGQSIRKNGKFYLPYLLTCIGTAAMFYIMLFLNGNEGLQAMRASQNVKTVRVSARWSSPSSPSSCFFTPTVSS